MPPPLRRWGRSAVPVGHILSPKGELNLDELPDQALSGFGPKRSSSNLWWRAWASSSLIGVASGSQLFSHLLSLSPPMVVRHTQAPLPVSSVMSETVGPGVSVRAGELRSANLAS